MVDYDGVDCRTTKQGRSLKAFYSHKFKSSGVRYGVASSISKGDIVHIDGPHAPGDWNDLMCFRVHLKPRLEHGERVEADDGYIGEDPGAVIAPGGLRYNKTEAMEKARACIRYRHETINSRLKQFAILSERFHHDIEKHGDVFRACAVMTQLSFEYDKAPFEIEHALQMAGY